MRTDRFLKRVNETKTEEWIKEHLTINEYERMIEITADYEEDLPF